MFILWCLWTISQIREVFNEQNYKCWFVIWFTLDVDSLFDLHLMLIRYLSDIISFSSRMWGSNEVFKKFINEYAFKTLIFVETFSVLSCPLSLASKTEPGTQLGTAKWWYLLMIFTKFLHFLMFVNCLHSFLFVSLCLSLVSLADNEKLSNGNLTFSLSFSA